jgi:hypothetical protein
MGLKAWIAKSVSNPSQYADSYASGLLQLTSYLASSFVAFSGEQPVGENGGAHETVFEDHFEMELSGFKSVTKDIAFLTQPNITEMVKERLFNPAYRHAAAFLCLYSENAALGNMKPENAERFANALYSSVAKRSAGQFGFHQEPRNTFMAMQEVIPVFRSNKVLNELSFGRADALGNVLNHLSLSEDKRTRYGFVVGSKNQPLGCASPFVKVLTDITSNIRHCAQDLQW